MQPIGGVNEKIEGFFDICNARGLTGIEVGAADEHGEYPADSLNARIDKQLQAFTSLAKEFAAKAANDK